MKSLYKIQSITFGLREDYATAFNGRKKEKFILEESDIPNFHTGDLVYKSNGKIKKLKDLYKCTYYALNRMAIDSKAKNHAK